MGRPMEQDEFSEQSFHTEDESENDRTSTHQPTTDLDSEKVTTMTLDTDLAADGGDLDEDGEDISDDETSDQSQSKSALLPAHLLASEPQPTTLAPTPLPLSSLTRKERKTVRARSRQAKKRRIDALRREAAASGVLEAGIAAQAKRGILSSLPSSLTSTKSRAKRSTSTTTATTPLSTGRVLRGRVAKAQSQLSGRQQLLNERVRLVNQTQTTRPKKKAAKKS